MAYPISASEIPVPEDHTADAAPAGTREYICTESLLQVAARQRPVGEVAQLAALLQESDQPTRAHEVLRTVATGRSVEDVAQLLSLLGDVQATEALHAAAHRPVDEITQLVSLLQQGGHPGRAQEVLRTVATGRPVEDVARMIALLGDAEATDALHAAAQHRPVNELALLAGHMDREQDASADDSQQARWRLRR